MKFKILKLEFLAPKVSDGLLVKSALKDVLADSKYLDAIFWLIEKL